MESTPGSKPKGPERNFFTNDALACRFEEAARRLGFQDKVKRIEIKPRYGTTAEFELNLSEEERVKFFAEEVKIQDEQGL
jgi:hypothetical protein